MSARSVQIGFCRGLVAAVVLVASSVQAAEDRVAEDRFLSHRVLYDMTLSSASPVSDIQNASGQMLYRFQRACRGWEVETRVFLELIYGRHEETEAVETTWSFDSFETFDGLALSFHVDHKRDGEPLEEISGDARRESGSGIKAFYFGEDAMTRDLPDRTLFPTAHLNHVLKAAVQGQKSSADVVFDGASMANPYRVHSAIVGRVVDGTVNEEDRKIIAGSRQVPVIRGASGPFRRVASAKLTTSPVWRIRMAYFPVQGGGEVPEFEIEADFREDGIAQRIVQDFGDFVLVLKPVEYEVLPVSGCP